MQLSSRQNSILQIKTNLKTAQDAVFLTHASHSHCSLECHDEIQSGMRKLFFCEPYELMT